MKTIICDVCKHAVQNPVKDRNYFHIETKDICEPCKDELELAIKPIVRTKQPFDYEWYSRVVIDTIEGAIKKGKFVRQ